MFDRIYEMIFGDISFQNKMETYLRKNICEKYPSVKKIKVKGNRSKLKIKFYAKENEYLADLLVYGELKYFIQNNMASFSASTNYQYYFI